MPTRRRFIKGVASAVLLERVVSMGGTSPAAMAADQETFVVADPEGVTVALLEPLMVADIGDGFQDASPFPIGVKKMEPITLKMRWDTQQQDDLLSERVARMAYGIHRVLIDELGDHWTELADPGTNMKHWLEAPFYISDAMVASAHAPGFQPIIESMSIQAAKDLAVEIKKKGWHRPIQLRPEGLVTTVFTGSKMSIRLTADNDHFYRHTRFALDAAFAD